MRTQPFKILTQSIFTLVTSVVASSALAQTELQTYEPHYLYQVELGGVRSWIFGTIHYSDIEIDQIRGLRAALESSKAVVLEKTLDAQGDYAESVAKVGGFTVKPTLFQTLNKKPVDRLQRFARRYWPGKQAHDHMLLGVMFDVILKMSLAPPNQAPKADSGTVFGQSQVADVEPSTRKTIFDLKILEEALRLGLPVTAADTTERNIRHYLKAVDANFLNSFIMSMINPDGSVRSLTYHDVGQFDAGTLSRMDSERTRYLEGKVLIEPTTDPAMRILLRRDVEWRSLILTEMRTHSTFVGVGLNHLLEKNGLLDYLVSQGAKVTSAVSLGSGGGRCAALFSN